MAFVPRPCHPFITSPLVQKEMLSWATAPCPQPCSSANSRICSIRFCLDMADISAHLMVESSASRGQRHFLLAMKKSVSDDSRQAYV